MLLSVLKFSLAHMWTVFRVRQAWNLFCHANLYFRLERPENIFLSIQFVRYMPPFKVPSFATNYVGCCGWCAICLSNFEVRRNLMQIPYFLQCKPSVFYWDAWFCVSIRLQCVDALQSKSTILLRMLAYMHHASATQCLACERICDFTLFKQFATFV